MLDVQFSVNSPVETTGRVRGPHVDRPQKLFAALLYFRQPGDDVPGGDLDLFRFRRRDYVERFDTVPYRPNLLVSWLNTPRSLHGVTPRPPNPMTRRYVNVMAEFYRLPGALFPIRRSRRTRVLRRVRRALGFRDALAVVSKDVRHSDFPLGEWVHHNSTPQRGNPSDASS